MKNGDSFKIRLRCKNCSAQGDCPKHDATEECWFERNHVEVDLATANGILGALRNKISVDLTRFNRAAVTQVLQGETSINKAMTPLSNTITRDLGALVELSIRFDVIRDGRNIPKDDTPILNIEKVNIIQIASEELNTCLILQKQLKDLQQKEEILISSKP